DSILSGSAVVRTTVGLRWVAGVVVRQYRSTGVGILIGNLDQIVDALARSDRSRTRQRRLVEHDALLENRMRGVGCYRAVSGTIDALEAVDFSGCNIDLQRSRPGRSTGKSIQERACAKDCGSQLRHADHRVFVGIEQIRLKRNCPWVDDLAIHEVSK